MSDPPDPLSQRATSNEGFSTVVRKDPCAYCGATGRTRRGRRKKHTIDHIVPASQGGTRAWDNITSACDVCNAKRGDRLTLMFLLVNRRQLDARRDYWRLHGKMRVGQSAKGESYQLPRLQAAMDTAARSRWKVKKATEALQGDHDHE